MPSPLRRASVGLFPALAEGLGTVRAFCTFTWTTDPWCLWEKQFYYEIALVISEKTAHCEGIAGDEEGEREQVQGGGVNS